MHGVTACPEAALPHTNRIAIDPRILHAPHVVLHLNGHASGKKQVARGDNMVVMVGKREYGLS